MNGPIAIERLRDVFAMVEDRTHWKNPVDAVVEQDAATPEELREAVIHFTGSVPRIEPEAIEVVLRHSTGLVGFSTTVPGWRVRAAGYFAAVGA